MYVDRATTKLQIFEELCDVMFRPNDAQQHIPSVVCSAGNVQKFRLLTLLMTEGTTIK